MRQVKIHFMSKKDMELEYASRQRGPDHFHYGKIACGSNSAYGVTWVKSKVDCLRCKDWLDRRRWKRELLRNDAKRESFHAVKETCPDIDRAIGQLETIVKEKTGDLREALNDALERALTAEEKCEELQQTIDELEEQVKELKETEQ